MKEQLQKGAKYLADLCLEFSQTYHGYTDKDLQNATLIFSHFLFDVIFRENQHLPLGKKMELAETTGKAIRELIKTTCDKDMHEIVKRK
jgi:ATP-dependent RNA circularization protein (DNA/RNA ligase family)